MNVTELRRRVGRRVMRRPIPVGLLIGGLVGWGLSQPTCAFKWRRGGGCAAALPGEDSLAGQLAWGALAAVATASTLWIMRRREAVQASRPAQADPD